MVVSSDKAIASKELESRLEASRRSLAYFCKEAWSILEPATPLKWNWHHDLICEELEEIADGNNKRLIINVMPRSLKSLIVSVFYPTWEWVRSPSMSYLCLSYSSDLAYDHSYKRRQVVETEWYQLVSKGKCKISDNRKRVKEFSNSSQGIMFARGLDSSVTGVGGLRILCLSPHARLNTSLGLLPIGQIVRDRIDCEVATYNHELEEVEYLPILRYEENPGREMVEIEMENGTLLECTADHLIYVEGKGYIMAGDLQPGDKLKSLPPLIRR